MQFRKPEWLDSAVGVAGLILSMLALLVGSNLSARGAAYGALSFSVFIILVSVIFRPRHSFKTIPAEDRAAFLETAARSAEEIIVVNPGGRDFDFGNYVGHALDESVRISVIGCAPAIQELIKLLEGSLQERFLKAVYLSESLSDEPVICVASRDHRRLIIMVLSERETLAFQLWDPPLVKVVLNLVRREHHPHRSFARLDDASDGRKLLDAFDTEQRKYLRNFETLRQGYVTYYGTDVQQLQSKLVESGLFKRIDTLDITTSPSLLLLRKRYLEANGAYIEKGGIVRRVYMIEEPKQRDAQFMADLGRLVTLQRAMGVALGLVLIEDLEPSLRKDFILFDDALALVEDRQANLDYTLAQSTAYFDRTSLSRYREHFNSVWDRPIRGWTPSERLEKIFPQSGDGGLASSPVSQKPETLS
jgi:hypothetical protein